MKHYLYTGSDRRMHESPLETKQHKEQKEDGSSLVSNFKGRQLNITSSIWYLVLRARLYLNKELFSR